MVAGLTKVSLHAFGSCSTPEIEREHARRDWHHHAIFPSPERCVFTLYGEWIEDLVEIHIVRRMKQDRWPHARRLEGEIGHDDRHGRDHHGESHHLNDRIAPTIIDNYRPVPNGPDYAADQRHTAERQDLS